MQLALTVGSALLLLAVSTAVMAVAAGAATAYLQAGNESGNRGFSYWLVWLGALAVVFAWAWLAGTAIKTPGMTDAYSITAVLLAALLFFASYLPIRKRTRLQLPSR